MTINFDIGLMAQEGKSKTIIDDFTHKGQNKFSIIFVSKTKSEISTKDACELKRFLYHFKRNFSSIQITSPFTISIPYDDNNRLLFKPLLDVDCYTSDKNIPKELDFQNFHIYQSYKQYTNQRNSDLKVDFSLSDDALTSVETSKKIKLMQHYVSNSKISNYFEILYQGGPITLSYIQKILANDLKVNLMFILTFVVLFVFFFNSVRLSIVYFITMLLPMAALIPLYYFFDLSLNPLSACAFIILAISCIEDFVFLICYNENYTEYNFKKFIEPSFYTSLTTLIGFASLSTSSVRDVVGFGLLCGLGAILEWISVFVFAPSLIEFFNAKFIKYPSYGLRLSLKISSLKIKSNFLFVSFILFGLGIFFGQKMKVDEDLDSLFFKNHQYFLVKDYMAQTGRFDKKLYVLSVDNNLLNLKKYLKDEELIESTEVYEDIKNELAKNLSPNVARFFKSELDDTNIYKSFHINEFNVAIITLKKSKLSDITYLIDKINNHCPKDKCTLFGKNADFAKYSKEILETLYKSFAFSFVLNGIILILLCHRQKQKQYLWVIYTSFWGPVTMFLCLYLLNIPLNFITCIFISIMLGLTGDNAIQYLFHDSELKTKSVEKIGAASLVTAIFSICGSLVLTFSGFRFTAFLGPIFALGFAINTFGDLFLLKTGIKSSKNN